MPDLKQLMAEEFKMTVDMEEYETEKLSAQLASQGKTGGKDDSVSLDVHSINELKDSMKVAPTNDASKYDYVGTEDPANYKFQSCKGKVIALRRNKQFVQSVESGQECGVLLDKTCFYAEQGGQIFDEGFLVKSDDDSVEFRVTNVQVGSTILLSVQVGSILRVFGSSTVYSLFLLLVCMLAQREIETRLVTPVLVSYSGVNFGGPLKV